MEICFKVLCSLSFLNGIKYISEENIMPRLPKFPTVHH